LAGVAGGFKLKNIIKKKILKKINLIKKENKGENQ
jgi:hypothetical protein